MGTETDGLEMGKECREGGKIPLVGRTTSDPVF